MLGVKSMDYNNYYAVLKGNYRKGVHRFRTMLANPLLAQEFAHNVGGVSVVLGWPIGHDDKNSKALLDMLLSHEILDTAIVTWLSQWYPDATDSADTLFGDAARCEAIKANALFWRAVGVDPVGVGKLIATLAGLDCSAYANMAAVAASQTAMTAVAASQTAMAAVIANSTALNTVVSSGTAMAAVAASQTAMTAVAASRTAMTAVAASQTAMAAVIANSTALNTVVSSGTAMTAVAASQTAMTAVAASQTAMAAIWKSTTAVQAVKNNTAAWTTFTNANSNVMGKTVAILAGLDPDSYADMTAVAASKTAMTAVAASQTAMAAVAASKTTMAAVAASQTAMTAVAASQTAMAAVAASQTAMAAVAASQIALNAIADSTTALDALYTKSRRLSGRGASVSGKLIILQISQSNAFDTSRYGYATLSDNSKPNWSDYKGKYAYFKQYKQVATYLRNDTEDDDWIDYFSCG